MKQVNVNEGIYIKEDRRKVRKDFDPSKKYIVDVSKCTESEKKEVQQAFFDTCFPWITGGPAYRYLSAGLYTNTTSDGEVTEYCMYGENTEGCNMTAKEFIELVYEPNDKESK